MRLKHQFVIFCLGASVGSAEHTRFTTRFTLEQIVQTRPLGHFAISADGTKVAYTVAGYYMGFPVIPRFGEDNNICVVSLDSGEITQITSGLVPKTKPVFSPLGERIAFESEEDIWVVDLGTGATRRLNTSIFRANDRAAAWSPDGERIAFVSNRDGQVDLWVMSVEGERHGLVRLTNDPAREEDPQWSPDGKTIVFSAKRRDEHYMATGVYVVSSTGGPARRLTPVDSTDNFGARWSPDGKRLALLSDRSGYVHVWIINADGTEWRELDTGPHDSMSPYWTVRPVWSRDGKRILISVNRDGRFDLVATDVDAAGGERIGTEPGQYHEVGWAYDGSIVYAYDSAWSPPNLYLTKPGVTSARRLTHSSHSSFRMEHFANVQRVSFRSFDGLEIRGFLLTPTGMRDGDHLPAIVNLHPNSYGQFYDNWRPFAHYLVQSGYVMLMIDQRGGSGYGRAFREKLIGAWGTGTLEDVKAGAEFVKSQAFVDPERVGVMGLSMGGYLTLLALTKAPEVFRAGADLMGITDLRSPFSSYRVGVGEKDNPELYERISPITSVNELQAPLLIIHSDQDRNVIPQQTYHLLDELDRQHKKYEVEIYRGEAHGLADPLHQLESYRRVLQFFDRYLKAE